MKILMLDHAFHKATGSSSFFIAILKKRFEVDHRFIDAENPDADPLFDGPLDHDLVLLWQFDYLAPLFLRRGMRTVVIPMYDGSANMPAAHWKAARGARFVNFSRTLHERVLAAGGESMYARYFPKPVEEQELPDFPDLRCFFWQRRPRDISVQTVLTMLGSSLRSLHVHNACDIPSEQVPVGNLEPGRQGFAVTHSTWFETQARYVEHLRRCNVFVAPRVSEGIGFGFLEAMSRGMCVIASDQPTHTEYLVNWVSGVLFNHASPVHISLGTDQVRAIGRMGWQAVRIGREQWEAGERSLMDWIESTPEPESSETGGLRSKGFTASLCSAYLAGGQAYPDFLRRHGLSEDDDANRDVEDQEPEAADESRARPALDANPHGLVFGVGAPAVERISGFGEPDVYSALMVAPLARAGFQLHQAAPGDRFELKGEADLPVPVLLTLAVAGVALQAFRIEAGRRPIQLALPIRARAYGHNCLDICVQQADTLEPWTGQGMLRWSCLRLSPEEEAAGR